ncbi:Wzz/FepE/Etk N-terminal domain-containing protein [Aeromonas piscicola]|uniref:Wzz/FepE/Etk N-terminal domain-containing protein n=1 Tax=Aeromonas piscicola TaxID=600645 RepID=UPI0005B4D424|nr:Wzz/FepE/Etk N-terminal domain-containing protein [Aeromonas piscicola]
MSGYGMQYSQSGEIDLHDLLVMLWKNKLTIVFTMALFFILGISNALLTPEKWTAKSTISSPKNQDTYILDQFRENIKLYGLHGVPSAQELYAKFILDFNSNENIKNYLRNTEQFREYVKTNNLGGIEQQKTLRKWSSWISATPGDVGAVLSVSSLTPDMATQLLDGYIEYVIQLQHKEIISVLKNNRNMNLANLRTSIRLRTDDAKRNLKNEIDNLSNSLEIAKAAAINKPLENYNQNGRFPIALGVDGLSKTLVVLKSIAIEKYMPELIELKVSADRLKDVALKDITYRPFSYLDSDSKPFSRDEPKRALIAVLSTLFGGAIGIAIVFIRSYFIVPKRHQLKSIENSIHIASAAG